MSEAKIRKAVLQVLAFFLFVVPVLAPGAQAAGVALNEDDPLFGTWINQEYDKSGRSTTARSVITPDGRQLDYEHIADTVPAYESELGIEETWVDASGNRWYKIRWTAWSYPGGTKIKGYSVSRVSQGGAVIEGVSAQYGYPEPEQLAPLGPNYGIMYRQE
jgi:hypothetical protein